MNRYPAKLNDSEFKGAVQVLHDVVHLQAMNTNGSFLKRILKERFITEMHVWYFPSFSAKLLNIINRKLQQLFVGGLIEYYNAEYKELINIKRYKHLQDSTGPKVLTMEHLSAGFIVWLVSVVLAIIIFVTEWIPRFGEYLVSWYIFGTYYKQKVLKMKRMNALVEARVKYAKKKRRLAQLKRKRQVMRSQALHQ